MSDIAQAVATYKARGLSCSQVLMQVVGLDARREESDDLINAMRGLSYGMFCQHTCGALTGAACAMALHTQSAEELKDWCGELSEWFEERFGAADCVTLLGEGKMDPVLCMQIISEVAERAMEILDEADVL